MSDTDKDCLFLLFCLLICWYDFFVIPISDKEIKHRGGKDTHDKPN